MKKQRTQPLRFKFWMRNYAKRNPVVTIGFVSAVSGGLLLLWYCFLIGELPEFALGDVTGLFVAACLTGVGVVGVLSFIYVAPAIAARYWLEQILPEEPDYVHVWDKDQDKILPARYVFQEMRAEIFSVHFAFVLTALPTLVCSLLLPNSLREFIWPSDATFVGWLMFLQLGVAISLIVWGNEIPLRLRNCLRLFLLFGFMLLAALHIAYRLGLDPKHPLLPLLKFSDAQILTSSSISIVEVISPHSYVIIAICALLATWGIATLYTIGERRRASKEANTGPPRYPRTKPSPWEARVAVAVAFTVCSLSLLILAIKLAQTNGPAHQVRTLGVTIGYLAFFNIMCFHVVNVTRQFLRAWASAIAVFVLTNLIATHSLTAIPKITVSVLGLGNFHASSVTLSPIQCSALIRYGVACDSTKDGAISLLNANVLNKMGTAVTLELQVRRDEEIPVPEISKTQEPSKNAANRIVLHETVSNADFIITEGGKKYIEARKCDEALASWLKTPWTPEPLRATAREQHRRMWCVTLNVPKDQFLGYTQDGPRTYDEGYTEFIAEPSLKM